MIGDPLAQQRLSFLLALRGAGVELDPEMLGSILSVDAGDVLERAGRLLSAYFTINGNLSIAAQGAGLFSVLQVAFGPGAAAQNRKGLFRVDAMRWVLRADAAVRAWHHYVSGALQIAVPNNVVRNLESAGIHDQIWEGTGATSVGAAGASPVPGADAVLEQRLLAANEDWLYDGIPWVPKTSVRVDAPAQRGQLTWSVVHQTANLALNLTYSVVLRIFLVSG